MRQIWDLLLFEVVDEARIETRLDFFNRLSRSVQLRPIRIGFTGERPSYGHRPADLLETNRSHLQSSDNPVIVYTDALVDPLEDYSVPSSELLRVISSHEWQGSGTAKDLLFLVETYNAIHDLYSRHEDVSVEIDSVNQEMEFLNNQRGIDLTLCEGQARDEILKESRDRLRLELEVFITSDLTKARIEVCANKYKSHDANLVSEHQISKWLRQFETELRAQGALTLLENVCFLSRPAIMSIYKMHYSAIPLVERENARICTFGHGGGSSAKQNYDLAKSHFSDSDAAEKFVSSIYVALDQLQAEPEPTIIFVDDVVMSGIQATKEIFAELLSCYDEKPREEQKQYPKLLTDEQRNTFARANVILLVCLTTEEGRDRVVEFLSPHCRRCSVIGNVDRTEKCFDENQLPKIWQGGKELRHAKNMCSNIGFRLYIDETDWDENKKQERSLGYGGRQKLIVCAHSVPTATLPIFWKDVDIPGAVWESLFPRLDTQDK